MSDGRRQVELSTAPVHYRAASGRWREIDTTVGPTDEPGFGFGAENGAFSALFGERGDRLMRVELGQRSLGLGLPDKAMPVRPEVSGERVLFRDVVGSADLHYTVGADAVKEEIVLEHAPETEVFTFDLQLSGVEAVLTQASTARHVQLKQRA